MKIKQVPVYHIRDVTMLLVLSAIRGCDALKMTITVNPLMKGQFPLLNYCVLLVQVQDTTQYMMTLLLMIMMITSVVYVFGLMKRIR